MCVCGWVGVWMVSEQKKNIRWWRWWALNLFIYLLWNKQTRNVVFFCAKCSIYEYVKRMYILGDDDDDDDEIYFECKYTGQEVNIHVN